MFAGWLGSLLMKSDSIFKRSAELKETIKGKNFSSIRDFYSVNSALKRAIVLTSIIAAVATGSYMILASRYLAWGLITIMMGTGILFSVRQG